MDHCDECGFRYDSLGRDELPGAIRKFGPRYVALLEAPEDVLRAHPIAGTWSALEYACHLRDVLRTQRERIVLALEADTPTFEPMRRDERVVEDRYNEQSPATVGRELQDAADELGDAFAALDDDGWQRTGVYSWPTTQVRTLDWVARNTVHEGVHHVMDIERLKVAS